MPTPHPAFAELLEGLPCFGENVWISSEPLPARAELPMTCFVDRGEELRDGPICRPAANGPCLFVQESGPGNPPKDSTWLTIYYPAAKGQLEVFDADPDDTADAEPPLPATVGQLQLVVTQKADGRRKHYTIAYMESFAMSPITAAFNILDGMGVDLALIEPWVRQLIRGDDDFVIGDLDTLAAATSAVDAKQRELMLAQNVRNDLVFGYMTWERKNNGSGEAVRRASVATGLSESELDRARRNGERSRFGG